MALLAPVAGGAEALREDIDRLAQPLIDRELVVGMSVGVIRGDTALLLHYGQTQAGSGRTPTDQSVYEIGSITKTFTGILLAEAVKRNELQLDDTLAERLPAGSIVPQHGRLKITLLHLASQSSGLPRMPGNFFPADPKNPFADYSIQKAIEFLSTAKLNRRPGEAYEYSNLGVGLLGHVLERAAAASYNNLVIDRVCSPLGMNETAISLTDAMRSRLAAGHTADGEPTANWDIVGLAGAGGLRSTPQDMMRYLAANLHPQSTPLAKPIAESHQPRFPVNAGLSIGLAWHISGPTIWHNGQTGGYHSYLAIHRDSDTAVLILSNTASPIIDALALRIAALLRGEPRGKQPLALPPKPIVLTADQAGNYDGTYAITPAFAITVRHDGGRVYARATGQDEFRLHPSSPTEFDYRIVDAKITFDLGADGKAVKLTLHQNGRDMPAARVQADPK